MKALNKYLLKILLHTSFCLFFLNSYAQYTNTHYIAPSPWSYFSQYNELVVTTLSTSPVNVSIASSNGTIINNSLTTVAGAPLRYRFTQPNASANASGTILNASGLIVQANSPIGVQIRNIASDRYTITPGQTPGDHSPCVQKGNSAFTSLGDQGLGTSFRVGYYANVTGVACAPETGAPLYSVMAVNNGTQISVNGNLLTTLNAGESYLFQAPFGSLVTSGSPVIVNGGMRADNSSGCADGVYSQLMPLSKLGTTYIVVRSSGNSGYERSTIVATQPNTTVTVLVPSTNTTTTYNLATAGSFVTINNGDGSTAYSTNYITSNNPVAVYSGSANGCEIDMIVQPPLSNCSGSFDVQTNQFLNNVNGGNSVFPYFGYVLLQSDTAKVYFNGIDLETIVGLRTQIGSTGYYMIRFTNAQLGNPSNLRFVVNARISVVMAQSGSGYSMTAAISSINNAMPPPTLSSNCLPAALTAQAGFDSYDWYLNGAQVASGSNPIFTPNQTGNYTVVGFSTNCGYTQPSTAVTINPKPNAGNDTSVCQGSSLSLVGTSNVSGTSWSAFSTNPTGATLGNTINNQATVTFSNNAVGNYRFLFSSGCTDTMNVLVKSKTTSTTNITICSNQLPYFWNGINRTAAGNYTFTTTNSKGCDSVATLILTVNNTTTSTTNITICSNQLPYLWNGINRTAAGNYTFTTTNSQGCDSVATLILTVNNTSTSTTNITICNNQLPYLWNGISRTAPGNYTFTTTNSKGCDSVASLILTVNNTSTSTTNITICSNQLPYFWNGINRTAAGNYTFTTTNSKGCDSVATLILTVLPKPNAGNDITSLCGTTSSFTLTGNPTGGAWDAQSTNPPGVILTGNSLSTTSNSVSGTFNFIYTVNGCTDTVALIISSIGNPPQIAINGGSNPICKNSTLQLCPTIWGWSNYQWYKNGVAIAALVGTGSCINLDSTQTGTYTLAATNGSGCWTVLSNPLTVIYNRDCTDSVTTGNNGGVESKSLGDVIGKRLYGNAINNVAQDGKASKTVFAKSTNIINGPNSITLSDITPTKVLNTNKSFISSPADLVNITNALEVLSVDYLNNKQTKAVAFATKTLGEIYNHTKPICDRLKGGELQEVTSYIINGIPLTAYRIKQRTGEVEYAINLTAGVATNRNTINIQSNWLTANAINDEIMYNYQIWANSYEIATDIANQILRNLQTYGPIQTKIVNDVPQVYVQKGNRVNNKLELTIQNNTGFNNGYFEVKQKNNENSTQIATTTPFVLKAYTSNIVELDVADNYEANLYMYVNGKLTDLVYLGDGPWTIDYNKNNTTVSKFDVQNEATIPSNYFKTNEYRLLRNIEVKATTKENVVLYKTLQGGGIEKDLNEYKGLKFIAFAPGVSQLKITIIQKGILAWDNQFSHSININENKEYSIGLDKFKSALHSTLKLNDVVGVTFNFINSRGSYNQATINLKDARFTKVDVTQQQTNQSKVISIYPNPVITSNFNAIFMSDISQSVVLKVIETATGKIVKTQFAQAQKGSNNVRVILPQNTSNGMYLVQLESDEGKYQVQKLLINKN